MKQITHAHLEINGNNVIVEGYVHYHVDRCYGADADGNRAQSRTIVEEVSDVTSWIDDADSTEVNLDESQQEFAEEVLVRKFLET